MDGKVCDHTSVGIFVWSEKRILGASNEKLLLIERGVRPWGFAVPAGHVDGDARFEGAAKRELKEEVGLDALELKLLAEGKKENHCSRPDGTWHYWKLYETTTTGEIERSMDETKRAEWCSKEHITELARRTEAYKHGQIDESEWKERPGLEPVMYEWFTELGIV